MRKISSILKNQEMKYNEILDVLNRQACNDIEGNLIVSKYLGKVRYYHVKRDPISGNETRRYVRKSDYELVKKLAQKSYNKKLRKLVTKRLRQFRSINKTFCDNELEDVINRVDPTRQELIDPICQSWEQRVRSWKNIPYKKLEFLKDSTSIMTNNHEFVRSKSEKILADLFSSQGIVYKYECPLVLKNGKTLYPDFTFLSPYTFEEIYWEHHGMMDDPYYLKQTLRKIQTYESNGIFRGQNLIITYESKENIMNYNWAQTLIEEYLKI